MFAPGFGGGLQLDLPSLVAVKVELVDRVWVAEFPLSFARHFPIQIRAL